MTTTAQVILQKPTKNQTYAMYRRDGALCTGPPRAGTDHKGDSLEHYLSIFKDPVDRVTNRNGPNHTRTGHHGVARLLLILAAESGSRLSKMGITLYGALQSFHRHEAPIGLGDSERLQLPD